METNREYHADNTHVGSSMLKNFRESPLRFKGLYVDSPATIERDPPSLEMVTGSITHLFVAGEKLESEFLIAEGCKQRSGKAWDACVQEAELKQLTPILPSQETLGRILADRILTHRLSKPFFECAGPVEEAIRWKSSNGILCKTKPDKLVIDPYYDFMIVPDLKTTSACSREEFEKAAWNYEYQCQAAMYLEGVNSIPEYAEQNPQFVYVVVSKKEPYDVMVLAVDPEGLFYRKGLDLYQQTLERLKYATDNDNWLISGVDDGSDSFANSGSNKIQNIRTPKWVRE